MHFALRFVVTATLLGLTLVGCSSDGSSGNAADGGEGGKGSGGEGSGGKGSGGKGSGGKGSGGQASGGKGSGGKGSGAAGSQAAGGAASMCAADTGDDACRTCLAAHCCSDYTDCVGSPLCNEALDTHAACIAVPGAETAACFGDLTRELQGDTGMLHAIPLCILNSCSAACAGPGPV